MSEVTEPVFDHAAAAQRAAELFGGPKATPAAPVTEAVAPVVETTEAVETTVVETTAPVVETPEPRVYKGEDLKAKFETEDLDELEAKWKDLSEKAKSVEKLTEYEQKLAELEEYRMFVDNPYGNENLKAIDAFSRKTGITDVVVAGRFGSKTIEQISQSPAECLALAKCIENPALLNSMTFEQVVAAVAQRNDIETDTKVTDLNAVQVLELNDAVAKLSAAYGKTDTPTDKYNTWKQSREQSEATRKQNIASWQGKIEVPAVTEIDLTEVGGQKLSYSVSNETKARLETELRQFIEAQAVPHSAEAQKQLAQYARSRVMELEVQGIAKQVYQDAIKSSSGVATEKAVKEFHNPAPVVKDTPAPVQQEKSAKEKATEYWKRKAEGVYTGR